MATPEELVPEVLDALPTAYGALLLLHADGATEQEIAVRLGVPVETIPSMAAIARSKLRRALERAEVGAGTEERGNDDQG